nr:nucleoprotein [plateau pika virus]QQJ42194.1 nucleoprotein [plateau pika virus]
MSDVPNIRWLNSLRKGLAGYTQPCRNLVIKDAQAILHSVDFYEVSQVQRIMRSQKRDDSDLQRLRDLNVSVFNAMDMKTELQKNKLDLTCMESEYLILLSNDLKLLKQKLGQMSQGTGVYKGNLTAGQLEKRSEIMKLINGDNARQQVTPAKVWNIKDSSLLINQFGTMPALTLACLTRQTQTDLQDVVDAMTDIGLLYSVKFPNNNDLAILQKKHPCLEYITAETPEINLSGFNYSLSAAVKCGAAMLDGGNMLETISLNRNNVVQVLKQTMMLKKELKLYVDPNTKQRNVYENLLYKLCLSGEGWPYIGNRTQVRGRSWDNTVVEIGAIANKKESKTDLKHAPKNDPRIAAMVNDEVGVIMKQFDPNEPIWMDIEGTPADPVELAVFQPSTGKFMHALREPADGSKFKEESKYCHGITLDSLRGTTPGVFSAIINGLPQGCVISCQGSGDIARLIGMHGREDIKFLDIDMSSEESRKFEDDVWKNYGSFCKIHTGTVVGKKNKKNGGARSIMTAHCALMDCIIYESATEGRLYNRHLVDLLPPRLKTPAQVASSIIM